MTDKRMDAVVGIKIRLEDPSRSRVCKYVRLNLLGPAGYAWERGSTVTLKLRE